MAARFWVRGPRMRLRLAVMIAAGTNRRGEKFFAPQIFAPNFSPPNFRPPRIENGPCAVRAALAAYAFCNASAARAAVPQGRQSSSRRKQALCSPPRPSAPHGPQPMKMKQPGTMFR